MIAPKLHTLISQIIFRPLLIIEIIRSYQNRSRSRDERRGQRGYGDENERGASSSRRDYRDHRDRGSSRGRKEEILISSDEDNDKNDKNFERSKLDDSAELHIESESEDEDAIIEKRRRERYHSYIT